MVKRSKLLSALDTHKGVDHRLERQKRLQKQAVKRKSSKAPKPSTDGLPVAVRHKESVQPLSKISGGDSEGWESDDEANLSSIAKNTLTAQKPLTHRQSTISAIKSTHKTTSDNENVHNSANLMSATNSGMQNGKGTSEIPPEVQQVSLDEESGQGDEAIPLSELEELSDEEKGDVVPHQRLTINNITALTKAYKSIALPLSELGFSEHQTMISAAPISIPDVNDDLNRELAFYDQCLQAAKQGRGFLKKAGVPFSRPNDYFAEMVKSDEHMGKIKQKMVDEAANKRAAAEARKQRDLKKFGKQVQVAKLQERDKAKRETLEKISMLKRSTWRNS